MVVRFKFGGETSIIGKGLTEALFFVHLVLKTTCMRFAFLLFLFSYLSSYSQTAILKDIKFTNSDPKSEYRFPDVQIQDKPRISKKINDTLRSRFLYAKPGCPESKLFDEIRTTPEHIATLYDIDYKVIYNKRTILSLSIEAGGCGAYCEDFTEYYNFNLRTGNLLYIDSLFTSEGVTLLINAINADKTKQLNQMISTVGDSLKSKRVLADPEIKSNYSDKFALYTGCLEQKISEKYADDLQFSFSGNFLTVYIHRCSAHYNMTLDDLWNINVRISLNYWKDHLTPYGKALLSP
jgi:hypothetical protein